MSDQTPGTPRIETAGTGPAPGDAAGAACHGPASPQCEGDPEPRQSAASMAAITLLLLAVWFVLSRGTWVPDDVQWLKKLGASFSRELGILRVGLVPWIVAVFVLQLGAALSPATSAWLTSDRCDDRRRTYRWVWGLTFLLFVVMVLAVVDWARAVASTQGLAVPVGADIAAALAAGSIGAGVIVILLQRFGAGGAVTLVAVLGIGIIAARRVPTLWALAAMHPFRVLVGLVAMAVMAVGTALFVAGEDELPPGFTGRGRRREGGPAEDPLTAPPSDGLLVRFPAAIVGVVPIVLADLVVRLLRSLCRGAVAEFGLHGPLGDWLFDLLGEGRVVTLIVTLGLVFVLANLAFRVLYPPWRLQRILGDDPPAEQVEALENWLDGLVTMNGVFLCSIVAGVWLFATPFTALGLGPVTFIVFVGGLAGLRRNLFRQWAVEAFHGALAPAATHLGEIDTALARARLERAGISTAIRSWTVHPVHPVTVPGMGEITILVPQGEVERARAVLAQA